MIVQIGMLRGGNRFKFLHGVIVYVFLGFVQENGFTVGEYEIEHRGGRYTTTLDVDIEVIY